MEKLTQDFKSLISHNRGTMSDDQICQILRSKLRDPDSRKRYDHEYKHDKISRFYWMISVIGVVTAITVSVIFAPDLWKEITSTDCIVSNNIFVMEMSRPIYNCSICKNLREIPVVTAITKEEFLQNYAYTSVPVLVKYATVNWTAIDTFSFQYFRELYQKAAVKQGEMMQERNKLPENQDIQIDEGSEESSEDQGLACQFFPYKSGFSTLMEAMRMSEDRTAFKEGEKPWYFGWSNCNEEIQEELRRHYQRPYFLPDDSETSSVDWMFMGGQGLGAPMHLDSVSRPSWQAQISGRKTWMLDPAPECLSECSSMNVTLERGDIFVVDTNQWYHGTFVHPGELSICIGSEYD